MIDRNFLWAFISNYIAENALEKQDVKVAYMFIEIKFIFEFINVLMRTQNFFPSRALYAKEFMPLKGCTQNQYCFRSNKLIVAFIEYIRPNTSE